MLWVRDSDQLIEEPDTMASCHRRNNGVPFSTGGALQDKWELRLPEDISNLGSHLLQFVNAGESKTSFPQGMVWTVNVWGCDAANNSSVQTNSLSPSVVICGDTLGAADGRKVYLSDGIRLLSPPEYIHVASYWDEPCPHQFSINTSLIAHLYKLSSSLQAVTYLLCSSVYKETCQHRSQWTCRKTVTVTGGARWSWLNNI